MEPETTKRLICDEMLAGLARWLRAAGYDTVLVVNGVDDRALMAEAIDDDRLILTRDRKFLERRDAKTHVFHLVSGRVDEQVREITAALGIDWMKAPFSRCLVDNTPVRQASDKEISNLPWPSETMDGPFTTCPQCGRLYWTGGHTRRMRDRLESWSRGIK